jgi:hypothetical protein
MPLDRDDTDERIARVKLMLADARLKKAQMVSTDRQSAHLLFDELEAMLIELLGPRAAAQRHPGDGGCGRRAGLVRMR